MTKESTTYSREGFTTGSAATAAAAAALTVLTIGESPEVISIPLPPDTQEGATAARLTLPVAFCCRIEGNTVPVGFAGVIKDAGDDPDVTNDILITAMTCFDPSEFPVGLAECACPPTVLSPTVTLHAGYGIGVATKPGLPVPVGEMAVNPAPRRQIAAALHEVAAWYGYEGPIHCRLSALDGVARAAKTLNSRLGIVDGISILGTNGTVKPFSADAWRATIDRSLDMAQSLCLETICLSTGRRSEKALQARYPQLPPQAFIQAADHAGHALASAAARGFSHIIWGCFPGKLLKLAQGLAWTHAHAHATDFDLFADLCTSAGLSPAQIEAARTHPTVVGALENIREHSEEAFMAILRSMADSALATACTLAAPDTQQISVTICVFDMQGNFLTQAESSRDLS